MSDNFYQETILYGSHYPSNPSFGTLFFNTSDNTLNIYLNGKWFDITSYFYNYLDRLINTYNNLTENVVNSLPTYQNVFNVYQNNFNQLQGSYTNLENEYNQLLSSLNNLISNDNNLIANLQTLEKQLPSFTNNIVSLKNNLQSNFVYVSSVSFQVLSGFYVYTFNFSNLYNSYISAFKNNFNVFAVIRRPIDYYYEGGANTSFLNVNETGHYAFYPLMYHTYSDLVYNSSNQNGSFSVAIGPQGGGVSNLSQGLSLHDYAQDSSAELYEIKFFAGPFNVSQTVSSNLSSSWYFNQYYGTSTYSGSNVSTSTLNIFGYSIGVVL